jgi:hypothetical protein
VHTEWELGDGTNDNEDSTNDDADATNDHGTQACQSFPQSNACDVYTYVYVCIVYIHVYIYTYIVDTHTDGSGEDGANDGTRTHDTHGGLFKQPIESCHIKSYTHTECDTHTRCNK